MTAQKTVKKKARSKNKKITLNEFHAWLDGIEELQPDDWSPDPIQWRTIRNKIDHIIVEVKEVKVPVEIPANVQSEYSLPQAPRPAYVGESTFTPPPLAEERVDFAPPPSAMSGTVPEITPAAQALLNGGTPSSSGTPSANMISSADGKIHTPNIDTSDGNFSSGFE